MKTGYLSAIIVGRPLLPAACFLILGILAGYYRVDMLPSVAAAFALAWTLYMFCRRISVLFFFLFFIAGFAVIFLRTGIDPDVVVGERTVIRGTIVDEARTRGGFRLIVETENHAKIMVQTMNEAPVGAGGKVEFEATLEELSRATDPGGFDEYLYFRARGVQFKTFIRELIPDTPPPSLLALRGRIGVVYDRLLPYREAGLIKAMVLGDEVGLGNEIKELYRIAGIYHLISISGLHISALAMFINFVLIRFIGRRPSAAATIIFLAVYCVFTGMSPSAVRAGLMSSVLISGDILYREKDLLSATAFAAVLILLWQPLYLFDPGFQYSFFAVLGIINMPSPAKFIASKNLKIPKILIDTFAVTLAATLATVPIAAWHFYYIMPYGLITNLIITPLSSFVLVCGFITGIVGLAAEPLAAIPAGAMYAVFRFYEAVCELFVRLPGAAVLTGRWAMPVVAVWYITIAVIMVYLSGRVKIILRVRFTGLLSVWIAVYLALTFIYSLPRAPEIYNFAEVDCAVLIDGSEAYVFDLGSDARTVRNYLDYHGVRRVAYFGLRGSVHSADAVVAGLDGVVYAVFANPTLAGLRHYEQRGLYYIEIEPGYVLRKNENLEFYITDGFGAVLRTGGGETEIIR